MRSIRTKITLLNIIAIAVSFAVTAIVSAVFVTSYGHESAEKELSLLCENGRSNINNYLKSVEQSVKTVSSLIDDDLDAISDEHFAEEFSAHMDEASRVFLEAANNTNGVLTYYYRTDLSITDITGEKGFWFTNLDGKGFIEHPVTDLSDDKYECVWFYTPKETGKPVWLSPYVTDTLDIYVISYNVPVYRGEDKQFIGVVGIEISYTTLGDQINSIKAGKTGYAYIVENTNGTIIFHPTLDILKMKEEDRPQTPEEFKTQFLKGVQHIEYNFQGVQKHSYWLPLSNNMSIVVCAPFAEVNQTWINMIMLIVFIAFGVMALFTTLTIITTRKITRPLKELTLAAEEINEGNYKVQLDYKGNDEIGVLTSTFNNLIENLDSYITDLNSLAYADALTSVSNKSAYNLRMHELQTRIDNPEDDVEFAIAILDCDNLKDINDAYGHDKGDIYLRSSCRLMCSVFVNSVVYRIGGDEFAVILEGDDYINRNKLKNHFISQTKEIGAFAKHPWEQIKVSIGVADYDPVVDKTTHDVEVHADHMMYEHKRSKKKKGI